jgi:hypothetical protein
LGIEQVALPAVKLYEITKTTSRMLLLIDQLPILFSEVGPLDALIESIKTVICKVLNCEKVNVFNVDSIHKVILCAFLGFPEA